MKKEVQNWLKSARYDLEAYQSLFSAGIYIHIIFMCHLALEKVLKAKVEEVTDSEPPKTHDLNHLVRLAELTLDRDTLKFVSRISNLSVITRYPRDFQTW